MTKRTEPLPAAADPGPTTAGRPRRRRTGKHPDFGTLERLLPPAGTEDAARWLHILHCEHCAEGALFILELPPAHTGTRTDYSAVFDRAEARAASTLAWLAERRERSWALVAELSRLPEQDADERVRESARNEPWAVITALLEVGRELARTDPAQAARVARWATAAAEQMDPNLSPAPQRAALLTQAECLLGDAWRRRDDLPAAEAAFTRAAAHLVKTEVPPVPRAAYCLLLSRLRRDQGRTEEAVALLHRARTLYDAAGDVVSAETALLEADELDPEDQAPP